ncbi:MAG TPA: 50S ribosomal protein L10 [Candidatus Paceibacterota bacterium]|nr:50S ribosomal protein L10 [Candidatus Paceibacterota bacterium]HRZ34283.1 50S ribosomal protein L10 [Candidatus Paceibacterota bacterium]
MAVTKEQKKKILEKLKDIVAKESVVFVNFHGVPSAEVVKMRKKFRDQKVSLYVAKKTLVKRALEEAKTKIGGDSPEFVGELALVYGDDPTIPAGEVYTFQKDLKNAVSILGGIFEKRFLSKAEMEEIAKIPGYETLKGMFVNIINAPIQGLVMSLKAIADKKSA